jgi:pentatricopeptide repeat protein
MMKQMECRGARRQALQVFRFLQDQSKFEMREQNYVTIMSILGREGKLGLIKEIFDQMRDATITPTVHSYSVLISG